MEGVRRGGMRSAAAAGCACGALGPRVSLSGSTALVGPRLRSSSRPAVLHRWGSRVPVVLPAAHGAPLPALTLGFSPPLVAATCGCDVSDRVLLVGLAVVALGAWIRCSQWPFPMVVVL